MSISLKRAYDPPATGDGYRVLVDRLWPRGLKRETARLDEWLKEAAPSDALRKWFHAHPEQWDEFRHRYRAELKQQHALLRPLAARARDGSVTLVYAARDTAHNNAVVLQQYLATLKD